MAYKGYKGCGPNKLGASPLKQYEKISSEEKTPDNKEKAPKKENNSKPSYFDDMVTQNDSLRSLPKTDQNHLPTFDVTTDEGQAEATKFYTQDGNNKKLRRLQKLGKKLRTKHGINKK